VILIAAVRTGTIVTTGTATETETIVDGTTGTGTTMEETAGTGVNVEVHQLAAGHTHQSIGVVEVTLVVPPAAAARRDLPGITMWTLEPILALIPGGKVPMLAPMLPGHLFNA